MLLPATHVNPVLISMLTLQLEGGVITLFSDILNHFHSSRHNTFTLEYFFIEIYFYIRYVHVIIIN